VSGRTAVSGYFRTDGSTNWSAAQFVCHDDWLDVTPEPPSTATQVPVDRIGLSEITGVDEVGPQSGALATIEIRRLSGTAFQAAVPSSFTELLCDGLRRVHSAAQPTSTLSMPMLPPEAGSQPGGVAPTTPVPPASGGPTAHGGRRKRRALQVLAVLAAAGVLGVVAGLFAQSRSQRDRAERAESELAAAQLQLDETAATLERTQQELATKQAALDAANAANGDLTTRVSELGNEKAQVQDERNAAQELSRLGADAAAQMTSCADLLVDIVGYVLEESYTTASIALDTATPVCQSASSAVGAFQAAAG